MILSPDIARRQFGRGDGSRSGGDSALSHLVAGWSRLQTS